MKAGWFIALVLFTTNALAAKALPEAPIQLYAGYITKIRCEGRLLISAIGNDQLVQLEALPKEIGCGALLKPLAKSGRTNVVLETSVGTIRRIIEIRSGVPAAPSHLEVRARPEVMQ